MNDLILGIVFIVLGGFITYDFIKNPVEKKYFTANTKGIIGGVALIIIGVLLLTGKIQLL